MTRAKGIQQTAQVALMRMRAEVNERKSARAEREDLRKRQARWKAVQADHKFDAAMKGLSISSTKAAFGMVGSLFGPIGGIISGIATIVTDFTAGQKQAKLTRSAVEAEMRSEQLAHDVAAKDSDVTTKRREATRISDEQRAIEDRMAQAARLA